MSLLVYRFFWIISKAGKSQTEIARELLICRQTVAKIIDTALELGVIGVREVAKVLQVNESRLYHEIRNQKRELMLKEES